MLIITQKKKKWCNVKQIWACKNKKKFVISMITVKHVST